MMMAEFKRHSSSFFPLFFWRVGSGSFIDVEGVCAHGTEGGWLWRSHLLQLPPLPYVTSEKTSLSGSWIKNQQGVNLTRRRKVFYLLSADSSFFFFFKAQKSPPQKWAASRGRTEGCTSATPRTLKSRITEGPEEEDRKRGRERERAWDRDPISLCKSSQDRVQRRATGKKRRPFVRFYAVERFLGGKKWLFVWF